MKSKTLIIAFRLFVFIILLFVLCVGVILIIKSNETPEAVDPLDVTYEGEKNQITINRLITVSSDFGRTIQEDNGGAFGYLIFDVVNHSEEDREYQVFVTKEEIDLNKIYSGYIIIYLTDENDQPLMGFTRDILPSYNQLNYLKDRADSKLLYKGTLKGNESAHFKLRAWISESYHIQDSKDGFAFSVDARAI